MSVSPIYDGDGRLVKVGDDLKHIAFIMDGNGRWAKNRGKSREYGHRVGAETFEKIVRYCGKIGIEAMTVYAFSTENWKRPEKEVSEIMSLLEKYIDRVTSRVSDYDVSVRFIGEKTGMSERLLKKMERAEESTANGKRVLNIALNYGSRAEIVSAVNSLIASGKTEITEEDIDSALYTAKCPEPDLVIRTAGERRLSNFLLWQLAYSEMYFTETLWPDFDESGVELAIKDYYGRTRRYGGLV